MSEQHTNHVPAFVVDGPWDDLQDQVFSVSDGVWRCIVNGKMFGDWATRGAAYAGMATEQRRAAPKAP